VRATIDHLEDRVTSIKELMAKTWEIMESKQLGRLGEVFTATTEFRLPGQTTRGIDEFRAVCEVWWNAFPDLKHKVASEIEIGDTYAAELVMVGTHKGTLRSPNGDIAPTGKPVQMTTVDYVTVKDGRIATWHGYPDMLGLLGQIEG
jgi:predicted ester cyclase